MASIFNKTLKETIEQFDEKINEIIHGSILHETNIKKYCGEDFKPDTEMKHSYAFIQILICKIYELQNISNDYVNNYTGAYYIEPGDDIYKYLKSNIFIQNLMYCSLKSVRNVLQREAISNITDKESKIYTSVEHYCANVIEYLSEGLLLFDYDNVLDNKIITLYNMCKIGRKILKYENDIILAANEYLEENKFIPIDIDKEYEHLFLIEFKSLLKEQTRNTEIIDKLMSIVSTTEF